MTVSFAFLLPHVPVLHLVTEPAKDCLADISSLSGELCQSLLPLSGREKRKGEVGVPIETPAAHEFKVT